MLRCRRALVALAIILATPLGAAAQGTGTPAPQPDQSLLKPEQLDALVAPIALYPDALLANVLAASTYPLEVVEADRWVKEHKTLKGDQLKSQLDKQSWDDSIKALTGTASVLAMMSDKLDWTKSLGDAVLAQQPDVMDAIQRLRAKAQANNKLVSTKQQKVSVQTQDNRQVIVIEPTDPDTMYIPYYDPAVVYGDWPYADYPPYYFGYPSYIGAAVIGAGLAFGAGYALGRWGNYWGGRVNWGGNNFFINRSSTINNAGWQHNPAHRQGVRYNNVNVQQRFGNNNIRAGSAQRMDFRGRSGQQVLNPGQDRGGARAAAADRGGAGAGAGARDRTAAGAANRAAGNRGGGDRQARSGDRGGAKQARGGGGARPPGAGNRAGAGRGDSAFRNMSSGRAANAQSARGRASYASMGHAPVAAGGGFRGGGGGGGFRGGGGGGFRGGGGGRRSDLALKHDVVLLGYLDNGLGYYRFSYLGSTKAYVGVIAQEVEAVQPEAVTRGRDGYLRVYYDKLGIKFRTYKDWLAGGAQIPTPARM